MADIQYRPTGTEPAPAAWVLPAALEILPKVAYASFDGTGAAGAFKPCLRIVSDAGIVAGEYVTDDTVAAGGSADVSWFRGLKGKASSGGTFAGVDYGWLTANVPAFASSAFTSQVSLATVGLQTTNAAVFGAAVVGGFGVLQLLATSSYLVTCSASANIGAAPAAGSFLQVASSASPQSLAQADFEAPFVQDAAGSWTANTSLVFLTQARSPGSPPPLNVDIVVGQNSSHNANLDVYVSALRLTETVI